MATCLCCSTSKLFLKLNDGLCENCLYTLGSYEDRYKELLLQSQAPNIDIQPLISNLLSLSIDLRRFDDISKGVKSTDCEKLIDLLSTLSLQTQKDSIKSNADVNLTLPNEPENIIKDADNSMSLDAIHSLEKSNTSNIEHVPLTDNFSYNIRTNTTNPPFENEDIIDISNHILSDLDENFESSLDNIDSAVNTDTPIIPKKLTLSTNNETEGAVKIALVTDLPPTDDDKTIPDSTINVPLTNSLSLTDDDKSEIENIINKLNTITTIDEKCYYTFLLRDKYLPILKENNISIIFDTDIEAFINENLNSASIILKCPVDDIFSYYNYVAFSIQTTGIHLNSNYIIELCAVKVSYGQVIDTFQTLINPGESISLATEKKTTITNEDLSKAPTLDVVLKNFKDFVNGLTLITHNANFNYKFIDTNHNKLFNQPLNLTNICTIKLYRKRYKHFHGVPTKDCSLYTCCHDLLSVEDLDYINQNSSIALSSALGTFKLYEIIKSKYR